MTERERLTGQLTNLQLERLSYQEGLTRMQYSTAGPAGGVEKLARVKVNELKELERFLENVLEQPTGEEKR